MNDQDLEKKEKPNELEYAEQLVEDGKFPEAIRAFRKLGKDEKISLDHRVSSHFLHSKILMMQGNYKGFYKMVIVAYNKSLGLDKSLKTVEALCGLLV